MSPHLTLKDRADVLARSFTRLARGLAGSFAGFARGLSRCLAGGLNRFPRILTRHLGDFARLFAGLTGCLSSGGARFLSSDLARFLEGCASGFAGGIARFMRYLTRFLERRMRCFMRGLSGGLRLIARCAAGFKDGLAGRIDLGMDRVMRRGSLFVRQFAGVELLVNSRMNVFSGRLALGAAGLTLRLALRTGRIPFGVPFGVSGVDRRFARFIGDMRQRGTRAKAHGHRASQQHRHQSLITHNVTSSRVGVKIHAASRNNEMRRV